MCSNRLYTVYLKRVSATRLFIITVDLVFDWYLYNSVCVCIEQLCKLKCIYLLFSRGGGGLSHSDPSPAGPTHACTLILD